MGSAWRGDVQERRSNGIWLWRSPASGGLPCGTNHGPARVTYKEEGGTEHGPTDAGRHRRACTVAYGDDTDVAGLDVAHPDVPARVGRQTFRSSLVQEGFSQNFRTKVGKELNAKVVDLVLLYNFRKRHRVFFPTVCAQKACQDH
jgi:hypothetical protein